MKRYYSTAAFSMLVLGIFLSGSSCVQDVESSLAATRATIASTRENAELSAVNPPVISHEDMLWLIKPFAGCPNAPCASYEVSHIQDRGLGADYAHVEPVTIENRSVQAWVYSIQTDKSVWFILLVENGRAIGYRSLTESERLAAL